MSSSTSPKQNLSKICKDKNIPCKQSLGIDQLQGKSSIISLYFIIFNRLQCFSVKQDFHLTLLSRLHRIQYEDFPGAYFRSVLIQNSLTSGDQTCERHQNISTTPSLTEDFQPESRFSEDACFSLRLLVFGIQRILGIMFLWDNLNTLNTNWLFAC